MNAGGRRKMPASRSRSAPWRKLRTDSFEITVTSIRIACVAALLALLWGLHRYRLHQIAREFNPNLEGRVDERLCVARELHDTLPQSFHGLLLHFQVVRNLLPGRVAEAQRVLEATLENAAQAITEARFRICARPP